MPTSATGRADRPRRAGFTLVELLVVVTIMGLASAVVVLSLPDTRPSLTAEAERLAARLLRAREEAVLTNRAVQVQLDSRGYQFRRRVGGEWAPLEEPPFERTAWEAGTTLAGAPEGVATIGFDVIGFSAPATVALARADSRARVAIDASGKVRVHASARR